MMETFSCAGRNPITLEVLHGYGHVGDLQSSLPCRAFADAPSLAIPTARRVHCRRGALSPPWPCGLSAR